MIPTSFWYSIDTLREKKSFRRIMEFQKGSVEGLVKFIS